MNIFEYEGKEFDKKLNEIFQKINKKNLKEELIQCGLEIQNKIVLDGKYVIRKEYINNEKYYNTYDIHKRSTSLNLFNHIFNKNKMEEVA